MKKSKPTLWPIDTPTDSSKAEAKEYDYRGSSLDHGVCSNGYAIFADP